MRWSKLGSRKLPEYASDLSFAQQVATVWTQNWDIFDHRKEYEAGNSHGYCLPLQDSIVIYQVRIPPIFLNIGNRMIRLRLAVPAGCTLHCSLLRCESLVVVSESPETSNQSGTQF